MPMITETAVLATMTVGPAGASAALVTWSSGYDCDLADEAAELAQVRDGILRQGLAALRQRFQPTRIPA